MAPKIGTSVRTVERYTNLRLVVMPSGTTGVRWSLIVETVNGRRRTARVLRSGWLSTGPVAPSPQAAALLLQSAASDAVAQVR